MLKYNLVFALRSFRKSGTIHFINLLGLTLGLSVFFLISLYIYQEKSYESDFTHRDRIYQLSHTMIGYKMAMGAPNLPYVLHEIPEVEMFTSFKKRNSTPLLLEGKEGIATVLYVDSAFLNVFDFELLHGDRETVLDQPNFAVVSEDKAKELFGSVDVVGKLINITKYDRDSSYQVPVIIKGVSKAPQFKTQLNFDVLVSEQRLAGKELTLDDWQSSSCYNYVVTAPNTSIAKLDQRLFDLSYKYVYPKTVKGIGLNEDEWRAEPLYCGFYAESISGLRSESKTSGNLMPTLDSTQLRTLFIIAFATLVISIFNFVNISTARASVRMREVGIKRIMGSSKSWLIFQFISESFLLILLSSILALALVEAIVKLKPTSLGIVVDYSVLHSQEWIIGLVLFIFALTLLAGIYPALYLSSGKLISILKNGYSKNSFNVLNAAGLRRFATILQFVCSIGLIASVITMFLQVDHLKTRDIGYDSGNVIVLDNTYGLGLSKNTFKNELLKSSSVHAAAYANRLPSSNELSKPLMVPINDSTEIPFSTFEVDNAFFEAMSMKFIAGTSFKGEASHTSLEESSGRYFPVIMNEVAAKLMGFENPVGEVFYEKGKVVGVVQDFVFSDLRQEVGPVVFTRKSSDKKHTFGYPLVVKTKSGLADIAEIQKVWSSFSENELKYHLLETNYSKLLQIEIQGFKAVLVFSVFAVIISCLGLLGLAIFIVDQRTHEFGVRKVLGASVFDIMKLFGGGFAKLMLIAFLLALPISIELMRNWLSNYADRIDLNFWVYLLTALIISVVVMATILFQSLKAGRLNPVDTLRNE